MCVFGAQGLWNNGIHFFCACSINRATRCPLVPSRGNCLIALTQEHMLRVLSLLLVLGQAASLRLPAVRVESRRSVLGTAAGLLLPLSLPTASHAVSADGTPDPTDDFNEFKEEKAAAMKATKEVTIAHDRTCASLQTPLFVLTGGLRAAGHSKAGRY